MNEISKALVARAYQKMMSGEPLNRDEEIALDEAAGQEMMRLDKMDERGRFLRDPNLSKGMTDREKRYEMSKLQRRGGPIAGFAGTMQTSSPRGGYKPIRRREDEREAF